MYMYCLCYPQDLVDESEWGRYNQLMEVIGWFFFDLLILGYVEDPVTGKSFRVPGGLQWAIYIEVNIHKEKYLYGYFYDREPYCYCTCSDSAGMYFCHKPQYTSCHGFSALMQRNE